MLQRFLLTSVLGVAALIASAASTSAGRQAGSLTGATATRQVVGAYTPDQIATAYDFAPLYNQGIDGTGQTVALIEIDKFNPDDLAAFDKSYDLPAPTIHETWADGTQFPLSEGAETTLDLEWLHALAPGATIQIYYVDNSRALGQTWRQMAQALQLVSSSGIGTVSISLGTCTVGRGPKVVQDALAALFHQNVSVFASSGDYGDHAGPVRDCGTGIDVVYPGSDPYVASVGGTSLHLQVDDTIESETAWKHSGGGRNHSLQRRPWQHAPTMPAGTRRWIPDVAFLGNQGTGVNFRFHGHWVAGGGTSLGAPAWAAAWALVRQNAANAGKWVKPAVKLFYRLGNSPQYRTAFHDITSGSNGTYHAGPGWDPVTGWGTPDVAQLAAIVTAWSPRQ